MSMGWARRAQAAHRAREPRAHPRRRADLRRARARPARAAAARRRRPRRRWRARARARRGPGRRTAGWRPTSPRPRSWSTSGALLAAVEARGGGDWREGRARGPRAARAPSSSCKGWPQEAALRMLMNNLDPEVAERPDDLVVYGGTGRAARSWEAFDAIVAHAARRSSDDETLLVQSGKPVGVFRTHEWAPRVLIANSNLVPEWATWDEFRRLEDLGLTMYGQMTAGLVDLHRHARASCRAPTSASPRSRGAASAARWPGTITLTAGLGGMGGAQPLAVTMNGGVALCIEVDRAPHRAAARDALPRRGGRPTSTTRSRAAARREASGARCQRRAARQRRRRAAAAARRRASRPTSSPTRRARTTRSAATCPTGMTLEEADRAARATTPTSTSAARAPRWPRTARRWSASWTRGAEVFDYGNSLRAEAQLGGFERAFDYPGFVPAYIRPLFCEGKGPFRWVALSGDPADIAATDRAVLEEFPDDERLRALDPAGRRADRVPGPAGADLLARLRRARTGSGCASTRWCARGELTAPIVIGRDHLDSGSVASPYRETEAMADESDAIADWPLLNALVNTSSGASWVSASTTAAASASGARSTPGMVCVADGTDLAAREARARADHRSRDGRHPPRRRRLRPRGRGRRASAACGSRCARAMSVREIVTVGDPVLRERAREVTRRGAALARGPAADRRPDRDDARGERRRAGGQPGRRAAADRGRRGRAGNPRYPYKPPIPLTVIVNPVHRAGRRRDGRDQRGLPVGARPARRRSTRHVDGPRALPRPRRRARTTRCGAG